MKSLVVILLLVATVYVPYAEGAANATTATSRRGGSHLRYKTILDISGNSSRRVRHGRILTLSGNTWGGLDVPLADRQNTLKTRSTHFMYTTVVSFLAWKHIVNRDGSVLPDLPLWLEGCDDLQLDYASRDSQFSAQVAVQQLLLESANDDDKDGKAVPFAVNGAIFSSVSIQTEKVSSGLDIAQVSGGSSSQSLDQNRIFARTVSTDGSRSDAMITFLKDHLNATHVACIYVQNAWGNSYFVNLSRQAKRLGVKLSGFPFLNIEEKERNELDVNATMARLKDSGLRYVIGVFAGENVDFMTAAYRYHNGIAGNQDYVWLLNLAKGYEKPDFEVSKQTNPELAKVIDGIFYIIEDITDRPHVDALYAQVDAFTNSTQLKREFLQTHAEPEIFDNFSFPYPALKTPVLHTFYDAMISIGLAACRTPGLFTGEELYHTLLHSPPFIGASGNVTFNKETGTRDSETIRWNIGNVFSSPQKSDQNYTRYDATIVATVYGGRAHATKKPLPVFYGNTTIRPPAVPPITTDGQLFGWILAAATMAFSLALLAWTVYNRTIYAIATAQPIFLCILCCGTFVMMSAIIPLGIVQGGGNLDLESMMTSSSSTPSPSLDRVCMSIPWLVVLGFVIALSALSCKTWRINKLMDSGLQMRRILVTERDAMWQFAVYFPSNVAMLVAWTLYRPLRYHRIAVDNVDPFGRNLESYGTCKSSDSQFLIFVISIMVVDLLGVAVATYQSYKARNLPTEFSESSYLALSMASLVESMALGVPILIMSLDDPTAFYIVFSLLLCVLAMTILLPIFVPKFLNRNATRPKNMSLLLSPSARNLRTNGSVALSSFLMASTKFRPPMEEEEDQDQALLQAVEEEPEERVWGKMRVYRTEQEKQKRREGNVSGSYRTDEQRRREGESRSRSGEISVRPPRSARLATASHSNTVSSFALRSGEMSGRSGEMSARSGETRSGDMSARSGLMRARSGELSVRFAGVEEPEGLDSGVQ
ncbi:expressed unknown protein (Partial), partial [Seminavis robusta]|eukprot:Sro733_g194560.1 n/a (990) ;mRNA; f:29577-32577